MDQEKNKCEQSYDSFEEVAEFQRNMYNPGHYIGTGKVSPVVSAPGNATPLAVLCFVAAVLFGTLGFGLLFSDVTVTSSGVIESPKVNTIIALVIMLSFSLLFLLLGFAYLRKAVNYHKRKKKMEHEPIVETMEDQIWQHTCPQCGETHDMDYPRCPHCKFDYRDKH